MYVRGGNKSNEATGWEISDRNASECIEPRNYQRQRGRQFSYAGRQYDLFR